MQAALQAEGVDLVLWLDADAVVVSPDLDIRKLAVRADHARALLGCVHSSVDCVRSTGHSTPTWGLAFLVFPDRESVLYRVTRPAQLNGPGLGELEPDTTCGPRHYHMPRSQLRDQQRHQFWCALESLRVCTLHCAVHYPRGRPKTSTSRQSPNSDPKEASEVPELAQGRWWSARRHGASNSSRHGTNTLLCNKALRTSTSSTACGRQTPSACASGPPCCRCVLTAGFEGCDHVKRRVRCSVLRSDIATPLGQATHFNSEPPWYDTWRSAKEQPVIHLMVHTSPPPMMFGACLSAVCP